MRFPAIAALLCAAMMTLPAVAVAGKQGDYQGQVVGEPQTEITFRVDRRKDEKNVKVFRFTALNLPTTCGGVSDTTEYSLPGYFGLKIKENRKFGITDSPSGFRDDSLFVMRGQLKRRGRAEGTVRVTDDFDFLPTCDTRKLDWRAHK
jgi:hypothetical protein